MARYGSDQVGFYLVGGYDILGAQTEIRTKKEKVTEETHTLGDAWVEHELVGLERAVIEQDGFYDDASDGNNDALLANVGMANVLCLGIEGNTIGKKFIGFAGALQADYDRQMSRGELHKARAVHQGVGIVEEGLILRGHSEFTGVGSDTESSPIDNGASSSDGGSGYLEVSALTLGGYDSFLVSIRHSADNITYGTVFGFANVTAAPAAERKTNAGTVNRYLACSWAFQGAGTGQSIKFMVGYKRN